MGGCKNCNNRIPKSFDIEPTSAPCQQRNALANMPRLSHHTMCSIHNSNICSALIRHPEHQNLGSLPKCHAYVRSAFVYNWGSNGSTPKTYQACTHKWAHNMLQKSAQNISGLIGPLFHCTWCREHFANSCWWYKYAKMKNIHAIVIVSVCLYPEGHPRQAWGFNKFPNPTSWSFMLRTCTIC